MPALFAIFPVNGDYDMAKIADNQWAGWGSGMLGVLIFSGSLPATRVAVQAFSPVFLTSMRAVIAALLGGAMLLVLRQQRPTIGDRLSVLIVALGVVVGFPLLTAFALQYITASHATVYIGLLPLSTAIFGVLRGAERPGLPFWLFSGLGALIVCGFALGQGTGADSGLHGDLRGDLLMLAAIAVCGFGYAEGALLTRKIGGWQVISWALLTALPLMALLGLISAPDGFEGVTMAGWLSLFYVAIFSMLVGFVFWYRGLAIGGISGVGQLQLLQPFFALMLAAFFLNESVSWAMALCTFAVVACVAGAKQTA